MKFPIIYVVAIIVVFFALFGNTLFNKPNKPNKPNNSSSKPNKKDDNKENKSK